ncbi:hypothetical protein C8Q74DRAFT_1209055 [Fomes fomentarius]|nr:hypothetical protein C8Q74DRAFT_1209055 [Fomes fomentarius]
MSTSTADHEEPAHAGTPLALPPPPLEGETEQLTINGTQRFKFDKLGPIVVNSDGTLSRIANWDSMTPIEKERTLRVLVARNKVRLANQESASAAGSEDSLSISNASAAP